MLFDTGLGLVFSLLSVAADQHQRYIVVLNNDSRSSGSVLDQHLIEVRSLIKSKMKKVKTRSTGNVTEEVFRHIYREGLVGYSGTFSWDVMAKIRQMEDVKLIERDGTMYATDLVHQVTPPWGLARVSRRRRIPSVSIPDYVYDSVQSGAGVTCYVIDTGINVDHDEFGMRARWGATLTSSGITDDNGHGTHVAGTIGSAAYGVAKDVELVAVKVLDKDGIGTTSDIIAGINWAVADTKANPSKKGSIANLSLGGAYSQAINMAVEQAVLSGLGMIVAAGNENKDACNYSPASSPFALSVGATNIFDKKAPFSNHGKCVSLFAPGEQILSTYIGSTKNTKSLSGTSMASPHVAGLAACFMSSTQKLLSPNQTYNIIMNAATESAISNLDSDSPNAIAYNSIL